MAGAALVVAGMLLGASESRAQEACAIPDQVPAPVYDAYLELLGLGFPMNASACDKLTKGVVSACHKSVSAATRCWKGVGKGLAKGAKTTCNEQGEEEPLCLGFTGDWLENLQGNVEASEAEGHASCDTGAPVFRGYCEFGIP
jgi:hypothetical protein